MTQRIQLTARPATADHPVFYAVCDALGVPQGWDQRVTAEHAWYASGQAGDVTDHEPEVHGR